MFDVRPIRSDEDHRHAMDEVDRLWGADPGTSEGDLLEVLAVLIDEYERRRWPTERVEPVEAIKAHMQMNGLVQADLGRLFGSESRASEILNRRRRLTVDMIAKLTNEWGLPADWLVQPYELAVGAEDEERHEKGRQSLSGYRFVLKNEMKRLKAAASVPGVKRRQPAKAAG